MTDKNIDIYAVIEQRKLELEKELAEVLKELGALEVQEKRIRSELASLPIRPAKRPAKKAAKAKRAKASRAPEMEDAPLLAQSKGPGDDD